MSTNKKRFVFVASTDGSVMDATLKSPFLKGVVHSVVVDRPCGAVQKAYSHGMPVVLFDEAEPDAFCQKLLAYMAEHHLSWVLSFYTNFYSEGFRTKYADRLLNFHPSLLPAFKGMDGFGNGMAYHVKVVGTTVELIKDVMDEGKIVMQTTLPADPGKGRDQIRHEIFVQQCKSLLQVVKWICEGRFCVEGDLVTIEGAKFSGSEFAPSLDFHEAIDLEIKQTPVYTIGGP